MKHPAVYATCLTTKKIYDLRSILGKGFVCIDSQVWEKTAWGLQSHCDQAVCGESDGRVL